MPEFNEQLSKACLGPVLHTDKCRHYGVDIRRTVLLSVPDGTKTSIIHLLMNTCVENKWTFIVCDVDDLYQAHQAALRTQPCMIFAEDPGKTLAGDKTMQADRVLNTLDAHNNMTDSEIVIVLATGAISEVKHSFLRPGRISEVVLVPAGGLCVRDADAEQREATRQSIRLGGWDYILADDK